MGALIILTFLGGVVGIGMLLYFLSRGQFDDAEEIKYQMFRDEKEV